MAHRIHKGFSFRRVFSGTFSLLALKRKPLAVSLLTFAMISAVLAAGLERRVARIEDDIALSSGLQREQLQKAVAERLRTFNQMDMRLLLDRMNIRGALLEEQKGMRTQEEAVMDFTLQVGPWILASFFVNLIMFFVACVFFLLLAGSGKESGYEAASRLPRMTLRMVGLSLWFLVRSLLWIPLLGPVIALYMVPRLVLSPVLVANEQAGIFESFHVSMRKTSHRWIAMFLALFGLCLISIALLWFGLVLVVLLTLFSSKLGYLLWLLTLLSVVAYQMFFFTVLTVES